MRVLFINDTARNGGPGRSLHSILRFLDPAVVHRAVVLPRDGAIADLLTRDAVTDALHFEPDLVENPFQPWGRVMRRSDLSAPGPLRLLRFAGNVLRAARGMANMAALVRRGGYQLIYCNGTNADFAGGALAKLTGVPALWHVRYTSLPKALRGVHRRLAASPGVGRVVCVSRASAVLFAGCPHKVRIIHNALDVENFALERVEPSLRRELGLAAGTVVFGSHGRVLRRKGYLEMVRAARVARDAMSEAERARTVFVVVGDTPEDFPVDHVVECRSLVSKLGMEGAFHMLGFREDIRPLVADFDVAVIPSVYADPLPRSVIESMALARPVIAFDVGGVAEMLDGDCGELVAFETGPGGDGASRAAIERLARAFLRYSRDPVLRDRQGRLGRARVLRDFDARAHARRIEQQILEVASPHAVMR